MRLPGDPGTVAACAVVIPLLFGAGALAWVAGSGRSVADAWRLVCRMVFGLTLVGLGYLLLQPTFLDSSVNLVPGRDLFASADIRTALENVVGNVALFVPLGLVGPEGFRSFRRPGRLAVFGLGLSAAVEAAQYGLELGRAADVTDVILNVAGILLGAGLHRLATRAHAARVHRSHRHARTEPADFPD